MEQFPLLRKERQRLEKKGYLVDVDGNIEFPILGKLHVGGLTLNEATEMIQQKIKEGNYIKSPLVSIEILNSSIPCWGQSEILAHSGWTATASLW